MTIQYGNYVFSEPVQIDNWTPTYRAGIYAILKPGRSVSPKPFAVLYFGESGNLFDRGFFRAHHRYLCWLREAGLERNLYIAVYLMPDSTPDQRRAVESALISQYGPICNRQ